MNKLKLFRITTVPSSIESLLRGQLHFLDQYYEVTAIASDNNQATWNIIAEREKVKCRPIAMEREIALWKDIKSLYKLYVYFRKEKPFIVHSITPKAGLLSMISSKLAGVPIRMHTFTGLIFPSKTGLYQKLLIWMDRLLCFCATSIYPEGEGVKKDLINYKITNKPLKVIANGNVNGINSSFFARNQLDGKDLLQLRQLLNMQADDTIFCFVGRLVKDKGINELVHAFIEINQQYPLTKLLLVGRFEKKLDPLLPNTEEKIDHHPNILFVGEQTDVRPYLAISDIFVFPSYREGFPNVVMEAGAMELPCIVTDINCCNEIIEDGVNGLIIPPKNEEKIKEKMLLLLNNNELRWHLKQNARKMITSRYEKKMLWEALLKEYKRLER
jgi:glycosyltransferase involved in cell wall biosynthesis